MSVLIEQAAEHWEFVAPLLRKPKVEADYEVMVQALDELLDLVGDDESHPLNSLIEIIGDWIEVYEREHRPKSAPDGIDILRYMMKERGLTQSQLPGVGPQSVVSEILSGKRQLNLRQLRWLAEYFNVPMETFL